jgi:hypothetical protein
MQTWCFISGPQDHLLSHPAILYCWSFVKEAVYVRALPTTLVGLKSRITTAVNSVTQDILLRVWDEFSYRLDVIIAAGGGTLNICELYCEYNQIYFTLYLSLVLCLICRLNKIESYLFESSCITSFLFSWYFSICTFSHCFHFPTLSCFWHRDAWKTQRDEEKCSYD